MRKESCSGAVRLHSDVAVDRGRSAMLRRKAAKQLKAGQTEQRACWLEILRSALAGSARNDGLQNAQTLSDGAPAIAGGLACRRQIHYNMWDRAVKQAGGILPVSIPACRRVLVALSFVFLVCLSLVHPSSLSARGRSLQVCPQGCPYFSIVAALSDAQSGDTVEVAGGVYFEHIRLKPGVSLHGAGIGRAIITGGDRDTVVRAQGGAIDGSVVIEGFTVIAGRSSEGGGGIDIRDGASPTIRDNLITANRSGNNATQGYGGGVYVSGGAPLITGNIFSHNYASWGGGAIAVANAANATVANNYIIDNEAYQYGGGISIQNAAPSLSGNTVISNTAYYGGGVDMYSARPDLTGNVIANNLAALHGGGVFMRNQSAATLSANTVVSNTANYLGGGVYMDRSPATLIGNAVTNNTADSGGGVYVDRSAASLVNNTITDNNASFCGAGVFLNTAPATISGNQIAANNATVGGGGLAVRGSAWPTVKGNIIADNAVGVQGGAVEMYNATLHLVNNLIARNQSSDVGSGLYVENSLPNIMNNTLVRNNIAGRGDAVYIKGSSAVTMTNNIVVSNTQGIVLSEPARATIRHNNIWANTAGNTVGVSDLVGNISTDPLFVRGAEGVYYLSQVSAGQKHNSPSLDAGNDSAEAVGLANRSTSTYGLPDQARVDMGYHYRALYYRAYLPLILGSNH